MKRLLSTFILGRRDLGIRFPESLLSLSLSRGRPLRFVGVSHFLLHYWLGFFRLDSGGGVAGGKDSTPRSPEGSNVTGIGLAHHRSRLRPRHAKSRSQVTTVSKVGRSFGRVIVAGTNRPVPV